MFRDPRARLPARHPVGWDFEALELLEREIDGEMRICSGMHDKVIGWNDDVPVHDDQVMDEGNATSSGGVHASSSATATGSDVGIGGGVDRSVSASDFPVAGSRLMSGPGVVNLGQVASG